MSHETTRQERWERKLNEVETLRDRLGKPVDRGIRETVAILQLIGLQTQQSCEGHVGWGLAAPWVQLSVPEADKLWEEIIRLDDRLQALDEGHEEFDRLLDERNQVREQHGRCEAHAWTILFAFLEAFYRQYPNASYEHHLVLYPNGRLTVHGMLLQPARDVETQTCKLQEYQEEMRQFTEYLQRQFLRHEV